MLTPPDLSSDTIRACVRDHFGLHITQVAFLPIGADVNSAVYRITTDAGTPFLLKLRRGNFNEVAVAVPALLRHAHGIKEVMAPLPTTNYQWWVRAHGFAWMLYPFFTGENGFAKALSPGQWRALGAAMRAVHAARLPPDVEARMPRATYAPHLRQRVLLFDQQVTQRVFDDPIAARLADFWLANRDEIRTLVARADLLAQTMQQHNGALVVCHADLHAFNVLVGADDALAIVDWDELILAPPERDLMFVGGGIGGVWKAAQESNWFYEGYNRTAVDPRALAYYRYERIVADLAAYAEQIWGMHGSADDRAQGLHELMAQFHPTSDFVVQIAHESYAALA